MERWEPYTAENQKVMFFGDKPTFIKVLESDFFRLLQHACEDGRIPYRALNAFDAEKEFGTGLMDL